MGICSEAFYKHLNPLSNCVTFTAIVPGAYPGRPKCAKNVLKWQTFELMGWITGKRLRIDGYVLWCVWQALNSLSIHVTFTVIVPWAYPGEAKMCKKQKALNPLSIHVTFTVPEAWSIGRPICALDSLDSQMPAPDKWLKAWHTGVTRVR